MDNTSSTICDGNDRVKKFYAKALRLGKSVSAQIYIPTTTAVKPSPIVTAVLCVRGRPHIVWISIATIRTLRSIVPSRAVRGQLCHDK